MFHAPASSPVPCANVQDLQQCLGAEIYVSEPLLVDQARIDLFAQATGDHQWIHVDPERAQLESPFGMTIAHGFLSLSLLGKCYEDFLPKWLPFAGFGLNYGLNKVRFMSPVRSGSQVRARFKLEKMDLLPEAIQLTFLATLEVAGQSKPACVAESVVRRQL
jgi:acyl dehydratase